MEERHFDLEELLAEQLVLVESLFVEKVVELFVEEFAEQTVEEDLVAEQRVILFVVLLVVEYFQFDCLLLWFE